MAEYLVSDPAIQDAHPHTQYDLIANICHEGEPGKGNIKCLYIKEVQDVVLDVLNLTFNL